MTGSTMIKRGKRAVAAAALATVGMLALAAPTSAAPAQEADISVTPESLDFGQVVVGETSEAQTLTFTNETADDAGLELSASGSGPGQFAFSEPFTCEFEGEPLSIIVPGLGSCEVGVVFEPQDVGPSTVTIDWLHEGGVVDTTELSGEGVADEPAPTCAPPAGPVSGPLHDAGVQLGPLGASLVNLAQELCAAGL